jgi:hypothetical protein
VDCHYFPDQRVRRTRLDETLSGYSARGMVVLPNVQANLGIWVSGSRTPTAADNNVGESCSGLWLWWPDSCVVGRIRDDSRARKRDKRSATFCRTCSKEIPANTSAIGCSSREPTTTDAEAPKPLAPGHERKTINPLSRPKHVPRRQPKSRKPNNLAFYFDSFAERRCPAPGVCGSFCSAEPRHHPGS